MGVENGTAVFLDADGSIGGSAVLASDWNGTKRVCGVQAVGEVGVLVCRCLVVVWVPLDPTATYFVEDLSVVSFASPNAAMQVFSRDYWAYTYWNASDGNNLVRSVLFDQIESNCYEGCGLTADAGLSVRLCFDIQNCDPGVISRQIKNGTQVYAIVLMTDPKLLAGYVIEEVVVLVEGKVFAVPQTVKTFGTGDGVVVNDISFS